MRRKRRYLYLPLVMVPLDFALTIWGQAAEYWHGSHAVNEGNPLAAGLLLIHPLVFLAAGAGWLGLVSSLVTVLPRFPALAVSIAVSQAHAWAAGQWVRAIVPYPHLFLGLLFLTGAALTVLSCERSR